jgi:hypothetical protein
MKKISLALLALGFLSITFQSCTTDPCKDKSATTLCNGKGTLVSNTNSCDCSCDAGYEGTTCDTEIANKYVGTWKATESYTGNPGGTITPDLVISKTSTIGTIEIKNFSDLGLTISAEATLSSNNKITLKSKNLTTAYTLTNGSGTLTTSTSGKLVVNITYIITEVSSNKTSTYTGTWTKI